MAKNYIVEMADHPKAILEALDQMREDVRRYDRSQRIIRRIPAIVIVLAILALVAGFFLDALTGPWPYVLGGVIFLSFFLFGASQARPKNVQSHFEAAYQLLHTLRDDTGRRGRVVGTLDLTGARQKGKLARTARSGGGKTKQYYRDPWFRVKIKLADGNLLRLTLEDKVKVKSGSEVGSQSLAKTKLVANPQVYQTDNLVAAGTTEQGAIASAFAIAKDTGDVQTVLSRLKMDYGRLKPLGPNPVSGQPT
jgi:hypothetical protein